MLVPVEGTSFFAYVAPNSALAPGSLAILAAIRRASSLVSMSPLLARRKPFIAAISECCAELGATRCFAGTRRTGADNSLDYLNLYTAAHQKLLRRIKIGSPVRYCLIWF
jgi:hypothetical protein